MATAAGGSADRRRRPRLMTVAITVATAVVAAAAVATAVAAATGTFGDRRPPGAEPSGGAYGTSSATVVRRTLTARTQVDATLGHRDAYAVVNQARGTITRLPAAGRVVRQGQVLYRVDGRPVVLLLGSTPAYRSLSYGHNGRDVAQLNAALVSLGHTTRATLNPRSRRFGAETARALRRLQRHLHLPRTGELTLGQAVFLPSTVRITGLAGGTVPGGPARPGAIVLSATSTRPVVTIDLAAARQAEVKAGDKVTVTLPTGRTTPGSVSSVGTVATTPSSDGSGGAGGSGGSGAGNDPATIKVEVRLGRPQAARGLDQAPVQVSIVTDSVRDALVAPVTALMAQAGGTYAVEVIGSRGNHLVAVSPGLFDEATGLVQVTGAGLAPGLRVVVPTS